MSSEDTDALRIMASPWCSASSAAERRDVEMSENDELALRSRGRSARPSYTMLWRMRV